MLHCRCLMSKFPEILILVCRKIFSDFYPILHETFSNSSGFPLMQEFNPFYPHLVLYDRKHFCSVLTDLSNLSFLFHQKFPLLSYDLKNVLTKQFPKMQKQLFGSVSQNRCHYKFPNIHKKISVLKSLCDTVRGLKAATLIKKRPQHKCFPVNITKFLRMAFL